MVTAGIQLAAPEPSPLLINGPQAILGPLVYLYTPHSLQIVVASVGFPFRFTNNHTYQSVAAATRTALTLVVQFVSCLGGLSEEPISTNNALSRTQDTPDCQDGRSRAI